jgi:hypothetical protein
MAPSLATCEHGHLVASRTGSGGCLESRKRAAPAGGAKREAARIAVDRSSDRPLADPSRYIGRNLHSRRSTRSPHQRQHRIWTVAIASGTVLLALPPVCTRPNTATRLEVLCRLAGRVRHVYWLNPLPQHDWNTIDSVLSTYAPPATKCSRSQPAPASRMRRRDHHQLTAGRGSAQRERLTGRQESVSLRPLRSAATWENGS